MPAEKRLGLHAQFPDAEHPVVRTHPETGDKVLFVNAFATHFTNFHTSERVRYGQDYAPGAAQTQLVIVCCGARPVGVSDYANVGGLTILHRAHNRFHRRLRRAVERIACLIEIQQKAKLWIGYGIQSGPE